MNGQSAPGADGGKPGGRVTPWRSSPLHRIGRHEGVLEQPNWGHVSLALEAWVFIELFDLADPTSRTRAPSRPRVGLLQ